MSMAAPEDAAWVSIQVPFGADALRAWLDDLEQLFRVNSLLEIAHWQQENRHRVHLRGRNLSNGRPLELELKLTPSDTGLTVAYSHGLKRSTTFAVTAAADNGSELRITDDYSGWSAAERQARLEEVDRSLLQWGQDLHRYFRAWHRWSWLPPWRWYVTRVWLPMKPAARRVTRWLWWIGLADLVLFLAVFAIFALERSR
jgi:hypothetical protein